MSRPDRLPRDWQAPRDVHDRAGDEPAQVEAAVKSVGEGGEVVGAVFAELQCVERSGERGLQVAEHRIYPLEVRQIARLAGADDRWHVHTSAARFGRQRSLGTGGTGNRQASAQAAALPGTEPASQS